MNGEKRATGGPKQPQATPEVTVSKEDLAALEAQLNAKNDALQFLRGVRFDLESARILAAQVEKREKGKMHVVDLLKQEYEMVLANPVEYVPYEQVLGCRRHHHDLVNLMQTTFETKRQKARKSFVSHQDAQRQLLVQQQQAQHQQQRLHQVEPMPGMRAAPPGSPGQMMYGQQQRPLSGASARVLRMGGHVPGQAERISQPQQYGMQHSAMVGAHGGFGGSMMPGGADGENLMRSLSFEPPGNSPLVSPSSMLDPIAQGGAHMMGRDARFSQPQLMQGVSRMGLDPCGGGLMGAGPGMGHAWPHAAHPHAGYDHRDITSDLGMRGIRNVGGVGQDLMPMSGNSFGFRGGDMPHQHNPPDHNLGRMPLAGDRGLSPMHDPTMMPGGSHLHGMSHMGNGQQHMVQQMRTSDSSGFGAQPRQQDGMAFMPQHIQDSGVQQQQGGFGDVLNANANATTATRPGGRSQRAAAQAARGRSFAAAADPFAYMDD